MAGSMRSKSFEKDKAKQTEYGSKEQFANASPQGPEADILALQDAAGNWAASQLFQIPQTDPENIGGLPSVIKGTVRTSGQPLDAATRSDMESRFGQNFNQIRIHNDAQAAASAEAVNAAAYAVKRDIVFNTGRYAPQTEKGKYLLAHELAHVIQQERGGIVSPSLSPNNPLEQSAKHAALTLCIGGTSVKVEGSSSGGLARITREEEKQMIEDFLQAKKAAEEAKKGGSKGKENASDNTFLTKEKQLEGGQDGKTEGYLSKRYVEPSKKLEAQDPLRSLLGEDAPEVEAVQEAKRRRATGRGQPERTERGTFTHVNAEALDNWVSKLELNIKMAKKLFPKDNLPTGKQVIPEYRIELDNGKEHYIDRVDFDKGILYEIKSDAPGQEEEGQTKLDNVYKPIMDKLCRRPGGWKTKVLVYRRKVVDQILFGKASLKLSLPSKSPSNESPKNAPKQVDESLELSEQIPSRKPKKQTIAPKATSSSETPVKSATEGVAAEKASKTKTPLAPRVKVKTQISKLSEEAKPEAKVKTPTAKPSEVAKPSTTTPPVAVQTKTTEEQVSAKGKLASNQAPSVLEKVGEGGYRKIGGKTDELKAQDKGTSPASKDPKKISDEKGQSKRYPLRPPKKSSQGASYIRQTLVGESLGDAAFLFHSVLVDDIHKEVWRRAAYDLKRNLSYIEFLRRQGKWVVVEVVVDEPIISRVLGPTELWEMPFYHTLVIHEFDTEEQAYGEVPGPPPTIRSASIQDVNPTPVLPDKPKPGRTFRSQFFPLSPLADPDLQSPDSGLLVDRQVSKRQLSGLYINKEVNFKIVIGYGGKRPHAQLLHEGAQSNKYIVDTVKWITDSQLDVKVYNQSTGEEVWSQFYFFPDSDSGEIKLREFYSIPAKGIQGERLWDHWTS
jgi:Domain of unknown function (DUF4157)